VHDDVGVQVDQVRVPLSAFQVMPVDMMSPWILILPFIAPMLDPRAAKARRLERYRLSVNPTPTSFEA